MLGYPRSVVLSYLLGRHWLLRSLVKFFDGLLIVAEIFLAAD